MQERSASRLAVRAHEQIQCFVGRRLVCRNVPTTDRRCYNRRWVDRHLSAMSRRSFAQLHGTELRIDRRLHNSTVPQIQSLFALMQQLIALTLALLLANHLTALPLSLLLSAVSFHLHVLHNPVVLL
jgi:hypothetical protein